MALFVATIIWWLFTLLYSPSPTRATGSGPISDGNTSNPGQGGSLSGISSGAHLPAAQNVSPNIIPGSATSTPPQPQGASTLAPSPTPLPSPGGVPEPPPEDSFAALAAEREAAMLARTPQGPWAVRVPAISEYAGRMSAEVVPALGAFQSQFPDLDPTEVQDFAEATMRQRATYGDELDEKEAEDFTAWLLPMEEMQRAAVAARGSLVGVVLSGSEPNKEGGRRSFWLAGFEGVEPRYVFTQNAAAAISTNVPRVRMNAAFDPAVGAAVNGDGLYVNVNDHGTIYDENPEFQLPNNGGTRIVYKEIYDNGDRSHMTHCAGTVGAWGYTASLMGMVPRVWIRSHIQQSTSDITLHGMMWPGQKHTTTNPRTGEIEGKSVMGTTSLGLDYTGSYNSTAASFDTTLRDYPYYIHFYAAANNGSAYNTISVGNAMAKNVVTIGSVSDATRDSNGNLVSGGNVSSFSSRGPTLDGRIKPDLMGNGEGLTSPSSATGSGSKSGTSMATPNSSGTATLLIDYIRQRLPGHYFRSSTIKALLINTADDRGTAGPDYNTGWGLINVEKAAAIVKRYAENPATRVVLEDQLASNQTWTGNYSYDGTGPVRVTLAWIDPAGASQTTNSTDTSPRLVNNLNLRLISQNGTIFQPWVMPYVTGNATLPAFDPGLYGAPATTGNNTTDNTEQVYIANPPAGGYTIQVTHGGSLQGGNPQRFSIAISGLSGTDPVAPSISSISPTSGNGTDNFTITVNGTGFGLGYDVFLRRAASGGATAIAKGYGVISVQNQITARFDTAALAKGYWDVVVRSPDSTEAVLPNAFLLPAPGGAGGSVTLYENNFENGAGGLILQSGWSVTSPNKGSVGGPAAAQQGTNALVTYPGASYPANATINATLPPISTLDRSDIRLSFQRFLGLAYNQSGAPSSRHADYGRIQWSTNNSTWTDLWVNSSAITDTAWAQQTYALPVGAQNQANLYLRFQLQTDANNASFGWNIDSLQVTGNATSLTPLPPVFTSAPVTTANEGSAYTCAITTTDPDTAPGSLSFSAGGLPPGLLLTPNGSGGATLSGTPSQSGVFRGSISVSDGTYTTWQNFDLVVYPAGGNSAPLILTDSLPVAMINTDYSATVSASDADGHNLTLSIGSKPGWLSFSDHGNGTASLGGIPPAGSQGTLPITITASDGFASAQKSFDLVIVSARVSVDVTDADCGEASSNDGIFRITRTGDTSPALTVNYSLSGTATNGIDYASRNGTLTLAAGSATGTVIIDPIDDSTYEGDETVLLTIGPGVGYSIGDPASAEIVLVENDKPTVSISASATTIEEDAGSATLTFTRSGTTEIGPLTVHLAVSGTASAGADYAPFPTSVTIPRFSESATLTIPILNDTLIEPAETLIATISANAAYNVAASPNNAATITLRDDTEPVVLNLSASDGTASEPAKGDGNGAFRITRSGNVRSALTIQLAPPTGSATAGADYTALPTSVLLPAGAPTVDIPLTALDDTIAETDEVVTLSIVGGSGYSVGHSASANINFYDDEPAEVRLEVSDGKCLEAATVDTGAFLFRRYGNRTAALSVNYSLSGTATNGVDYNTITSPIPIGANTASATLTITPVNDALVEGPETVTVTLAAGTGYTVGPAPDNSATLDIRDDETIDVTVAVQDAVCAEGAIPDPGSFRITRTGATTDPLAVNYTITGNATNGTDFTALSGNATIPAGSSTVDIPVVPINDTLVEGAESVILTLAFNGAAYDLGDARSATLWIRDDETPTITVTATDPAAAEPEGGLTDNGQWTFNASFAPASDLTLLYTVSGGTNGADYARLPGTLILPAGQTSVTLDLVPLDDELNEAAETVGLTLLNGATYNSGTTAAAKVVIAASDTPAVRVYASRPAASENPLVTGEFRFESDKIFTAKTNILYFPSGTATNGSDYNTLNGTVTINAGSNTAALTLTPVNDTDSEGTETVLLTITDAAPYSVATGGRAAAVTIADDEADGSRNLLVTPVELTVPESSTAAFTVALAAAPTGDVSVAVARASGDADLFVQSGVSLVFTPANWATPQTVTIGASADADALAGSASFSVSAAGYPTVFVTATEADAEAPPAITLLSPEISPLSVPDLGVSLELIAAATDTVGTPSIAWTQISGPAAAVFANPASGSTSVTFPAAGTYVLRATATDHQAQTASLELTVFAGASGAAFTPNTLGATNYAGSAIFGQNTVTVTGTGGDISGGADSGHYLTTPLTGNFSITARLASLAAAQTGYTLNAAAKAGLVVRQSGSQGAQMAFIGMSADNNSRFIWRATANATTSASNTASLTIPRFLRLERSGNVIRAFHSADGITWTQQGSNQTITMPSPVQIGFAVASGNVNAAQPVSVFDSITGLPAANGAPQIAPGPVPSASAGIATSLVASVTDDGLPVGSALSTAWTVVSKPEGANVIFADTNSPATQVTFSAPGNYTLRLSATDGPSTVFEELGITVASTNTPPTISPISAQTIPANSSTGLLSFAVGDTETDAADLTVTATSSNQTLVPDGNITIGGSGASRTVTITPATNKSGTATITLTVSDGTLTASTSFSLTVTETLESWISTQPDVGAETGASQDPDGDGVPNLIEFALGGAADSPDTALLPAAQVSGGHLTLTFTPHRVSGLAYFIEASSDLSDWSESTEITSLLTPGQPYVHTDRVSGPARRFMRLRVEVAP